MLIKKLHSDFIHLILYFFEKKNFLFYIRVNTDKLIACFTGACYIEIVTSREEHTTKKTFVIHSSNRVREVRGRILMPFQRPPEYITNYHVSERQLTRLSDHNIDKDIPSLTHASRNFQALPVTENINIKMLVLTI